MPRSRARRCKTGATGQGYVAVTLLGALNLYLVTARRKPCKAGTRDARCEKHASVRYITVLPRKSKSRQEECYKLTDGEGLQRA